MKIEKIDLEEARNRFPAIFLDYIKGKEALTPFYHGTPELRSFKKQIQEKATHFKERRPLAEALEKQYQSIDTPEEVSQNINALRKENTFTVTTGHQLNIFTGPLYFIYKIVSVINTCKLLAEQYPSNNFVPVFWMASEDHDFDEINHFKLFGKDFVWETDQSGAVGRMHPDGIGALLDQLPEKITIFEEAYREYGSMAAATRYFVNALFGKYGLVVIDGDDPDLKSLFKPLVWDDLTQNIAHNLVNQNSEKLKAIGYKPQVTPREINFFFLENGLRERIIKENGKYKINNTPREFTEEEFKQELEAHPEKFSPNVIMRPLYQETILPNLAYVGGPAEIAYWLQMKSLFDHYQIPFPVLLPRNFCLIIHKSHARKFRKMPLLPHDLFLDNHQLKEKYVSKNAENQITLDEERKVLEELYKSIRHKALAVNKSLDGFIGAETNKTLKNLADVEKRIKKEEEQKQETGVKQLAKIKDKLFPDGNLQERTDNFLNFYINDPDIITQFIENFDPFDFRFNILIEYDDDDQE